MGEDDKYEPLYIEESVSQEQLDILNRVRADRDKRSVDDALQSLRNAASDPNANTMPFIIDAVKVYASVGEISDTLREAFGTYQEPALF